MQVSFTSRVKIIAPSYIAKINAENVRMVKFKKDGSLFDSHVCIESLCRNAISRKYTPKVNRAAEQFENEISVNFLTHNKEQTEQIIDVFEKAKQPDSKNYTIRLGDLEHKFNISEY